MWLENFPHRRDEHVIYQGKKKAAEVDNFDFGFHIMQQMVNHLHFINYVVTFLYFY